MYNLYLPYALPLKRVNTMNNNYLTSNYNFTSAAPKRQLGYLAIPWQIRWDNFPQQAQRLVSRLDGQVISKEVGADLYHWSINFEGTRLNLYYEDNSESCWLEVECQADYEVLEFIATLLEQEI